MLLFFLGLFIFNSNYFYMTCIIIYFIVKGARCRLLLRGKMAAYGAMGRRIDTSWLTHWTISRSSQCSMTGLTKAMVCTVLSVGWCI